LPAHRSPYCGLKRRLPPSAAVSPKTRSAFGEAPRPHHGPPARANDFETAGVKV
jgi:hypothetical protein